MEKKIARKRVTTADLMVAITGLGTAVARIDTRLGALETRFDTLETRFDALEKLIDRRSDELMAQMVGGFTELHAFTEFSLGRTEARINSRMDRRFDLVDNRFDEVRVAIGSLDTRVMALEMPRL